MFGKIKFFKIVNIQKNLKKPDKFHPGKLRLQEFKEFKGILH